MQIVLFAYSYIGIKFVIRINSMEKILIEQLKEILEGEKIKLIKELENFAVKDKNTEHNWDAKPQAGEKTDMEEKAGQMEEYDNLLSLEHSLELKLKDVNIALEKILNGGYGACEKCKKEIEKDRMMAYPEARLCIECNKVN